MNGHDFNMSLALTLRRKDNAAHLPTCYLLAYSLLQNGSARVQLADMGEPSPHNSNLSRYIICGLLNIPLVSCPTCLTTSLSLSETGDAN
jgi:hypothetical protein